VDPGKRGLLFTSEPSTAHGLEAVSIGSSLHTGADILGLFIVFAFNWSNGEIDLCCHQVEEIRCLDTKTSAIVSKRCKCWMDYIPAWQTSENHLFQNSPDGLPKTWLARLRRESVGIHRTVSLVWRRSILPSATQYQKTETLCTRLTGSSSALIAKNGIFIDSNESIDEASR
jgi:hypothetical protein